MDIKSKLNIKKNRLGIANFIQFVCKMGRKLYTLNCIQISFIIFHQSKQVPCWMFIMWISQMMALLDKPEGSTVHHILDELTENYPQVFIMQCSEDTNIVMY